MAPIWSLMDRESAEYVLYDEHCAKRSLLSASIIHSLSGEYSFLYLGALADFFVWEAKTVLDFEFVVSRTQPANCRPLPIDLKRFWTTMVPKKTNWASWDGSDVVAKCVFSRPARYDEPSLLIGYSDCLLDSEACESIKRHILRRVVAEFCWANREGKAISNSPNCLLQRISHLRSEELRRYIVTFI